MRGISAEPTILNARELGAELHRVLSADPAAMTMLAEELGQNYQTTRSQLLDNKSLPMRTVRAGIYVAARTGLPLGPLARHWLWPGMRVGLAPEGLAPSENWEREAGDVSICSGRLLTEVRAAIEDERIDSDEDRGIRATVDQAKRELDEVLALLDRARARGGSVCS